jgi:drug/metabolite transporter (DMT)-like permease
MSVDRREHRPVLAVLLKFLSVALFAIVSAGAKHLGGTIPVGEIIAVRSAVGVAAIVLITWRTQNLSLLRTAHWQSHALRSSAGSLAMACWFVAINLAPIADATATSYAGPLFATPLAALLLRERIRAHRWLAVALGFIGVLIMTGSYLGHADAAATGLAFALLCAFFAALSMIFLRQMSGTEHALTTTFYFCLTSLCGATLTTGWGWPMPDARAWLFLVLIGLLGTGAQFLMTAAFRYAEASVVVPVEYTGVGVAALLGYAFFDEVPGVSTWVGAPLVIVAGLLIVGGEYRVRSRIRSRARKSRTRPKSPHCGAQPCATSSQCGSGRTVP